MLLAECACSVEEMENVSACFPVCVALFLHLKCVKAIVSNVTLSSHEVFGLH